MLATRIIQAEIARQATYWYSYGEVHSKQEFDVKRGLLVESRMQKVAKWGSVH